MNTEPDRMEDVDRQLKEALKEAVAPPVEEVDWHRLHARIMSEAERRRARPAAPAYETVSAWSSKGTPLAAAALLAASLVLWVLPDPPQSVDATPPGFWPVAAELFAGLPPETQRLLGAGTDAEAMLQAVVESAAEERPDRR